MRKKRSRDSTPIVLLKVRAGSEENTVGKLRSHGVRSYYPKMLENSRTYGMRAVPLFAGYLFTWVADGLWGLVNTLDNVFGFVSFGVDNGPALVRHADVARLRAMEGPTGYIVEDDGLCIGDFVDLRNGLRGKFVSRDKEKTYCVEHVVLGQVLQFHYYKTDLVLA